VILNEFQMNCRHDALGTRLCGSGFHNKLESQAVTMRFNHEWTLINTNEGWPGIALSHPYERSPDGERSVPPATAF
jgi:hypothetical protein